MEIGIKLCPGPEELLNVLPLTHLESKRAATLVPTPHALERICSPTFVLPVNFKPTNGYLPPPAFQIMGPFSPTNPTTTGPFSASRLTTAHAAHVPWASCPCFQPLESAAIKSNRPVPVTSTTANEASPP